MIDLEIKINQVWHQEVRPLVAEAYRCYTSGSARASIMLTWTAVCADLIHKIHQLAEDGDGEAQEVVDKIEAAQKSPDSKQSVQSMQQVESGLLDTAEKAELIDHVQKRELSRLKEDRNLSAHPSLRPLGELFAPTTEYARAHLAAAMEALLLHPPSQGRRAVERYRSHVDDPGFIGMAGVLTQHFFDRAKSGTRRSILSLAAKHALLELPTDSSQDDGLLADRHATCLRTFAESNRELAAQALIAVIPRFPHLPLEQQIRAVVRLADLDIFWDALDSASTAQLDTYIERICPPDAYTPLPVDQIAPLSLVEVPRARTELPSLRPKFQALSPYQKASVIARRPGPYGAGFLAAILKEAGSFRMAESLAKNTVPQCAPHMTEAQLGSILEAWAENYECRASMGMLKLAPTFYSLVPAALRKHGAWQTFLDDVKAADDSDGFFSYQDLEEVMKETT
ncbi:hypothetical protein GCM10010331_45600 [Streptomyces xanthochromogenes]|uniref:hypothetical protein n=1 Tax=Streptomyces xanthochromogenes TaxID=67384 RepID=UPI0016782A5E|nr:hypothetical protein [Streptomyces xanthochromogenes]GHB52835.1 hypothetical protein GCM10010331_45600 [Streptomyces xanthochromogenes]